MSFFLEEPGYFGDCPRCGREGEFVSVGTSHFALCEADKVFWTVGSNPFSSWRGETEGTWEENHARLSQLEETTAWHRASEFLRRDVPVGLRIRNALSPPTWKERFIVYSPWWRGLFGWTPRAHASERHF